MQKRWYDLDPTVSLAVSLMKNADEQTQLHCADYIINKAKNFGMKRKENALNEALTLIFRRWYDKDKRIQESFEYFQAAPPDVQHDIAVELLRVLQIC